MDGSSCARRGALRADQPLREVPRHLVERVRAVTLAELDRFAEAETAVRAGLEDARRQGLAYETARLLATSTVLDRRVGRTPDADHEREAAELFDRLGARGEQPATAAG